MFKSIFSFGILLFIIASTGYALPNYPRAPDLTMTPGVLCTMPTSYRYPSQIPYCTRDVTTELKWQIITAYMTKFNFVVDHTNRDQFKIDHFIPLCMGGANDIENLWPQHQSVYEITDALELALCKDLSNGTISQSQAIEKMKFGKFHLDQVPALINEANELR